MDSSRHWPSSRTKPMLIWRTFDPVESVTSRNSMGRNATLSRVSVLADGHFRGHVRCFAANYGTACWIRCGGGLARHV